MRIRGGVEWSGRRGGREQGEGIGAPGAASMKMRDGWSVERGDE